MRRCHGLFRPSDAFFRPQFSADYIISIAGFDFRQAQVTQMPFAEDNDMVETFPSDRANQSFRMSILPWRLRRGGPITNAHGAKPPFEYLAVDTIAIADDVPRHRLPAAGLGKLPGDPLGRRMRRHAQP